MTLIGRLILGGRFGVEAGLLNGGKDGIEIGGCVRAPADEGAVLTEDDAGTANAVDGLDRVSDVTGAVVAGHALHTD